MTSSSTPSVECSSSAKATTNGSPMSPSTKSSHCAHNPHHNSRHHNNGGSQSAELNECQVERLRTILCERIEIHGRENFPTLEIPLHRLIDHVRRKLDEAGLHVTNVKMNGGAGSHVLATADNFVYSDLDLIFPISLANEQDFDRVRTAVFAALLEMMPESANKDRICADTLKDVYIRKMVKVSEGDRWSLFSLHNDYGRCIELKFVDRMRRQFQFSVDSFQITLDPLLQILNDGNATGINVPITAESRYGDFMLALSHLNQRLIDTRHPEEIRGGGLLKYCHLISLGYHATPNCRAMERYMCSRFFIDFPDINVQEIKLRGYLDNHFGNEDQLKFDYLQVLYRVIRESTVCLMGHERTQTLQMVDRLRHLLSYNIYYGAPSQNFLPNLNDFHHQLIQYQQQQEKQQRREQRHKHQQHQHHQHQMMVQRHQQRQIAFDLASNASSAGSGQSSTGSGEESTTSTSITMSAYVPRQTLLYLPHNANQWIPVV